MPEPHVLIVCTCGAVILLVAILAWRLGQWLGLPWGVVALLEWGAGTLVGWWAHRQSEHT